MYFSISKLTEKCAETIPEFKKLIDPC